jgi:hypothetical protein
MVIMKSEVSLQLDVRKRAPCLFEYGTLVKYFGGYPNTNKNL